MAKPTDKNPNGTNRELEPEAPEAQFQLRFDETQLSTNYSNAFRVHGNPEELIIDFGINIVNHQGPGGKQEVVFHATDRQILNYYSVKRLAITLTQRLRQHENDFGELELDQAKRRRTRRE